MTHDLINVPAESVESSILLIRGQKVILDRALARLYGVSTKALNQAVKRNPKRFPPDFMFQLTMEEASVALSKTSEYLRARPYAFTEHGILMLSSILRTNRAIQANIQIMRNLVRLRKMLGSDVEVKRRLDEIESTYDKQFKVLFDAIQQLLDAPVPKRKPIGFRGGPLKSVID